MLNPPYLLFYPDRNNDDVPDGDPEVHLQGFGLEDTHSVVNSLRWGPDGWLYAAQGSTVTGHVTRPGLDAGKEPVHSMGQLIWRYHPETRRYEVFAEGGGNAFGVEIDAKGRIYSGHNGGDTRGFHYVQGGYYQKGFNKHGPLSNPYAFGYFPAMKHNRVPRFTHTFVIYEADALPQRVSRLALRRRAAVEPRRDEPGASRRIVVPDPGRRPGRVDRPTPGSGPVDIKLGPDGALYIADWYDRQVNHYRNHEGQIDPGNGRIYRLKAADAGVCRSSPSISSRLSTPELVKLLADPNKWTRQTALRLIGDRKDPSIAPELKRADRARNRPARPRGALGLEPGGRAGRGDGLEDARPCRSLRAALDGPALVRCVSSFARRWRRRWPAAPRSSRMSRSAASSPARRSACPRGMRLPIVRALLARSEDAARHPLAALALVGHRSEGRDRPRGRAGAVPGPRDLGPADRARRPIVGAADAAVRRGRDAGRT